MGMIIRHNLQAQNANNALNSNVLGSKKATEKLSTGYQINRAGDNASGLAVSEKMRAQIGGLTQAVKNVQDGISLIQTAEGGLNETHSILQRMRDLSVQSANGTYQQEDRDAIDLEVQALQSEIDRISESTEYNGIKLLNGDLDGVSTGSTTAGPRFGAYLTATTVATGAGAKVGVDGIRGDGSKGLEGSVFTSSVNDVKLVLTSDAGQGKANATWDATGKTLTMNLSAGKSYTQGQIDDLIKNAVHNDGSNQSNPIPEISLKLKAGSFTYAGTGDEEFRTVAGQQAAVGGDITATAGTTKAFTSTNVAFDGLATSIKITSNVYGNDARKIVIKTDGRVGKESVETPTGQGATDEGLGIKAGTFTIHLAVGVKYSANDIEKLLKSEGLDYKVQLSDKMPAEGDEKFLYADKTNGYISLNLATASQQGAGVGADKVLGGGKGLTFQIGANGVEDQRVTLNVKNMSSEALGIDGIDVKSQDGANAAIDKIDKAINTVSLQRAGLGALQNRLEHTNNNLNTTNENLTSAEASIRDTDIATEMINYTKFNILQQAAQSMLAQANQAPQAALQLLG